MYANIICTWRGADIINITIFLTSYMALVFVLRQFRTSRYTMATYFYFGTLFGDILTLTEVLGLAALLKARLKGFSTKMIHWYGMNIYNPFVFR